MQQENHSSYNNTQNFMSRISFFYFLFFCLTTRRSLCFVFFSLGLFHFSRREKMRERDRESKSLATTYNALTTALRMCLYVFRFLERRYIVPPTFTHSSFYRFAYYPSLSFY